MHNSCNWSKRDVMVMLKLKLCRMEGIDSLWHLTAGLVNTATTAVEITKVITRKCIVARRAK